ncbi:MAG: hypothetical protein A3F31_03505 [Candidatus Levybacteria bacterium RIFCSPHIGHO2_12_FULL_38_12]|nr:MAG: hypothetical protein A2770_04810 [Candidatus Levybacteria bacterium RIFCSPHIGHO2_01_FULL_38_12]OGH21577.1 MAG: hypothetical protein A3D75_02435 [Candidatus Levybacteria bacterium RIFCSPHIGHO2_02_FULL_37_18]OGH22874.1 MAG: hypothetical protein A3F31_03505 [Candidatus Levybacteria bacterium RIFCSPHIGHO2_12_FULL_38_12]OGH34742.1 MAG: hypothetical protein A3A47_01115 [Candidatus Levybacteria bacterium RIFCSPLOWO2_01_FULL_37_20]OGH43589.1 MAG: hypothetical protein A3J14_03350 [Candidatus Lev
MTAIKSQAIQTALTGDWNNAILLNKKLIKENSKDIDTLNRLAFAYTVVGRLKEAKTTYQKVIGIDKKNPIALRNLKRLSAVPASVLNATKPKKGKKGEKKQTQTPKAIQLVANTNNIFLEESGKTKIVDLVNVAEPKVISTLLTGEKVFLRVKRLKVFVLDDKNRYIGMIPDNIAKRLIAFINGGNMYESYVKSSQNNHVSIFIKEVKRADKFKNQPTFILGGKGKPKIEKFPKTEKTSDDHQNGDED